MEVRQWLRLRSMLGDIVENRCSGNFLESRRVTIVRRSPSTGESGVGTGHLYRQARLPVVG